MLYCRPCRMVIDNNALLTMILGGVVFIPAAVFAAVKIAAVIAIMTVSG
ncbi:MAG: hypothetical protein NC401_11615 [Ruminococcus sp.]|nr:hypothetical protein [Ruminococcus sp.]